MKAGELRHLVTIEERPAPVAQDSFGQQVDNWQTFAQQYAAIEPLSGRDYLIARQELADVTHRIRMRFIAGVSPKMRVTYGARIFQILSALNTDERDRELVLMVSERIK